MAETRINTGFPAFRPCRYLWSRLNFHPAGDVERLFRLHLASFLEENEPTVTFSCLRFESNTELDNLFSFRVAATFFLRRRSLYPTELRRQICRNPHKHWVFCLLGSRFYLWSLLILLILLYKMGQNRAGDVEQMYFWLHHTFRLFFKTSKVQLRCVHEISRTVYLSPWPWKRAWPFSIRSGGRVLLYAVICEHL